VLTALSNLFLFAGQIIIPRLLSRVEFAEFTVSISFVSLVALIADLGLQALLTKLLAEAEEDAVSGAGDRRGTILGSAIALKTGMSLLVVAIVLIVGPFLYSLSMVGNMTILLVTLLISSRLFVIRAVGESALRSLGKYYVVTFFALLDAMTFALLLYYGQFHNLTLNGVLWIYSLCNLPGFILLVFSLISWAHRENIHLRVSPVLLKRMLVQSIPLILTTAFLTIYSQIDAILLDKLSTPIEVSSYGAMIRLISALVPLSVVLGTVTAPEFTRLLKRGDKIRSQRLTDLSLRVLLILAVGFAITLSMTSNEVVGILFGSKYASAAPLLVWVGWMLVPLFVTTFLMDANNAAGFFWHPTIYTSVIMISVIAGDLLLIRSFGAAGAMGSKLIAISLGCLILVWLSRNTGFLDVHRMTSVLLRIGLAAVLSILTYFVIHHTIMNNMVSGLIVIIMYLFLVTIFDIFGVNEARVMIKRIKGGLNSKSDNQGDNI